MPHCTLNFLLCGNQPLSAPGQLISFQPAFLGSPRVPSALPGTLLRGNQPLLAPGQLISFHLASQKTCISWIPLDAQCPSGILHCGKQPLLAPCHLIAVPLAFQKLVFLGPSWVPSAYPGTFLCGSQPLSAPGQLFSFHLTSQKTCVSWLPLGAKCLPGTFLCVCGRPPLSAPGQLILFPLAFQKIVFLGSPWVLSALLALFFIVTNHFWPLAHSFRFTLLSKSLCFLASSGHHVPFLHSSSDSSAFCQYSLQPGTPKTNSWACVIFKKNFNFDCYLLLFLFLATFGKFLFQWEHSLLLMPPGSSMPLAPQASWLLKLPGSSNLLAPPTPWRLKSSCHWHSTTSSFKKLSPVLDCSKDSTKPPMFRSGFPITLHKLIIM